jgi:hypothetical protein
MEECLDGIELKDTNFMPLFCSKHRKDGYKNFAKSQAKEPKAKKNPATTTKNLIEIGQGVSIDDINKAKIKKVGKGRSRVVSKKEATLKISKKPISKKKVEKKVEKKTKTDIKKKAPVK